MYNALNVCEQLPADVLAALPQCTPVKSSCQRFCVGLVREYSPQDPLLGSAFKDQMNALFISSARSGEQVRAEGTCPLFTKPQCGVGPTVEYMYALSSIRVLQWISLNIWSQFRRGIS